MINNMFLDYKDCSWKLEIESCNLCRIIIISNTTIKIINKNVRIMIANTRPGFKQNFHSKASFSFL